MSGFVGDFVAAAGCDGGGNALAGGVNTLFSDARTHPNMHAMQPDAAIDELAGGIDAEYGAPAPLGWQGEYFMQADPMSHEFLQQQQHHHQHHQALQALQLNGVNTQSSASALQQQQHQPQVCESGADWAEELLKVQETAGSVEAGGVSEGWAEQYAHKEEGWVEDYEQEGVCWM